MIEDVYYLLNIFCTQMWSIEHMANRGRTICCYPGGGGTHILRQTEMYHSDGSLFYKKSLNMGPVFQLVKNGPICQEKLLTMVTLSCQNDP